MKKIQLLKGLLFLASILNISISHSQAPTFEWAVTSGGASSQINSRRVLTDANNNIFVAGSFNGTVDFDPGVATNNITSAGQQDGYVVKFDPMGNLLWVKTFGGVDSEGAEDMHFDSQGNIVLTGIFSLTVDFDPGVGIASVTGNGGYSDIFILKLTSSGIFTYVKTIGGTSMDISYSLEIDDLDNIYITGQCLATADFDPGVGVTNLPGTGIFVLKLNGMGSFIWAKRFANQMISGTGTDGQYDFGSSLCVDNNYNVHIVGEFKWNVDFDPSGNSYILITTPASWTNVFYAKLDINGNFVNAHNFTGGKPYMVIDDFDNLYLSGNYIASTTDFDPSAGTVTLSGPSTQFIRKTDVNSSLLWVINTGGSGSGYQTKPLALDNFNNIFFSSYYQNTIDLDPSALVNNITSLGASGNRNVFISKFNDQGNFIYGLSYGSAASNNESNSIVIDNSNSIISTGVYASSQLCDFDPSASIFELTGGNNFLQKLGQCVATSSTIAPISCISYTAPDGAIYTNTGQYFATIPSIAGCDSVITINLTVNNNSASTIVPSVCGTYTAPDGAIYTSTGQYFATIPSIAGCDSVITINLTVNNNTSSTISPSVCATYTSPDNQIYTQSGLYSATIPSFAGCDSVITIDLTVNQSSVSSQTQTALDSYTWPVNSQTYSSSGIYTAIIPNAAGCDSTITLNLTLSFTGIIELNSGTLTLSPNPTTFKISVKASLELIGKEFSIYDQLGKAVKSGIITSENTEIDLSNLTEGTYLFKIGSEMMESFKIIKQ